MEAVSNSIHAITERFDDKAGGLGRVQVTVLRDLEKDDLPIIGFEVEDNGIGFTSENYRSFLTPDSRHKERRGGKGVGRLAWLKVFEQVEVDSVYQDHSTLLHRHFNFRLTEKEQVETVREGPAEPGTQVRTRILFRGFDPRFAAPACLCRDRSLRQDTCRLEGTECGIFQDARNHERGLRQARRRSSPTIFSKPSWRSCGDSMGYARGKLLEAAKTLPRDRKDWYD